MKKVFLYGVLTLILVASCKKANKLTQFEVDYTEEVVIPSSTGISLPFDIITPEQETNSEATFEINNTRKDLIEEILLTELRMTVTTPEEEDFSFLESISIYISADGLSEQKIAWKENIAADSSSPMQLETADVDMQAYIKKDKFVLRCNTVTDEVISSDYYLEIFSNFFVDAKLIK